MVCLQLSSEATELFVATTPPCLTNLSVLWNQVSGVITRLYHREIKPIQWWEFDGMVWWDKKLKTTSSYESGMYV